jgi:hypothetical protein
MLKYKIEIKLFVLNYVGMKCSCVCVCVCVCVRACVVLLPSKVVTLCLQCCYSARLSKQAEAPEEET